MKILIHVFISILLVSSSAFAQGDQTGGGGVVTEGDFRKFIGKIDRYLYTEEGQAEFPEIVRYDQAHPSETFHQLVQTIHPVVKKGELKDQFGNVRDCLSYQENGLRFFVCNSDALPRLTLDSQPSFYRITFHELLVHAGIEKPIASAVPSDYTVSWRILENVHLESYEEWVPGKPKDYIEGTEVELEGLLDNHVLPWVYENLMDDDRPILTTKNRNFHLIADPKNERLSLALKNGEFLRRRVRVKGKITYTTQIKSNGREVIRVQHLLCTAIEPIKEAMIRGKVIKLLAIEGLFTSKDTRLRHGVGGVPVAIEAEDGRCIEAWAVLGGPMLRNYRKRKNCEFYGEFVLRQSDHYERNYFRVKEVSCLEEGESK